MRRISFLFVFVLFSCSIKAESVEIDGIFYKLTEKTKTAKVTENPNKYKGEVVIPNKVIYESLEYEVTTIDESAFSSCGSLTKVVIPSSVTSIGNYAFSHCYILEKLDIPNSVTSIGDGAFSNCWGLEMIKIPDSTKTIGSYAFQECINLKEIFISKSVESVGSASFYNCKNLSSLKIEDLEAWCKIKAEGTSWNPLFYAHKLFINDVEISELQIPSSVNRIEEGTFAGGNFSSITIPESVTEICGSAFACCDKIKSIVLPNSITSIGLGAFCNCYSLEYVVLPQGLKEISGSSLYGPGPFPCCISLKEIVIPDGVQRIGNSAFMGCEKLKRIVIPESVERIDNDAFSKCEGIEDVYCYAKHVPTSNSTIFDGSLINYATLHVPSSSIGEYKDNSVWGLFKNVVALNSEDPNPTGMKSLRKNNKIDDTLLYNLKGQRIEHPVKGVYIKNRKKILIK